MSLQNRKALFAIGAAFVLLVAAGNAHAGNTSTNTSNNTSTNTSSDPWSSNSSSNSSRNSSGFRGRVNDQRRDLRIDERAGGRFFDYRYELNTSNRGYRGGWRERDRYRSHRPPRFDD
jgi:hypothetical protein